MRQLFLLLVFVLPLLHAVPLTARDALGSGVKRPDSTDTERSDASDPILEEVTECLDRDGSAIAVVTLRDRSDRKQTWDKRCRQFHDDQQSVLDALPAESCSTRHRYRYSPVVSLEIRDHAALAKLRQHPLVERVRLDDAGSGSLDQSRKMIGVDTAYDLGLTGEGIVVAVIDTGIDASSPEYQGRVIHEYHFLRQGLDVGPGAQDLHGHGTHVTGILASKGAVGPRGVLPEASIVAIQVLNERNRGSSSDWARGLDYAVSLHNDEDNGIEIDVINISASTDAGYVGHCDAVRPEFSLAAQAALDAGILVFVASGNNGSTTELRAPACIEHAISVGSVYDASFVDLDNEVYEADDFANFTDRNDHLDLLAPGIVITSSVLGGELAHWGGTSLSAPHAAGVAGLLKQVRPDLGPKEILAVLKSTGVPIADPLADRSFPRIDAVAALSAILTTLDCDENGSLDFFDLAQAGGDCDANGIPDACDLDSNGDGHIDACPIAYRRGDVNDDGKSSISDSIYLISHLFLGGPGSLCADASDTNSDTLIDLSDVVFLLNFLFRGGPSPFLSGESCGFDLHQPGSAGDLGCEEFQSCANPTGV